MKINEGMRDAAESLREHARCLDEVFDTCPDNETLALVNERNIEETIKMLSLSLYNLQRCERLNK